MRVKLVAAVAANGVIGRDGGLPWRLSTDLKRFREETMGKPVVMGRKTWESIGRALPGRLNIVVTRDRTYRAEGAEVAPTLADALTLARVRGRCMVGADEICIIGGGDIYAQAMPLADVLSITHVLAEVDGDTVFPPIPPETWQLASSTDVPDGEKDSHPTRHALYVRKGAVAPR